MDVRSDKFDLETSPGVRLSTLHSAEGLEFSEVFLVLSRLRIKRNMDHAEALAQSRNLIYVALTRAMDNPQVFTLHLPEEDALQDLVRAFEQISVPFET